jgi:hypothetical protein
MTKSKQLLVDQFHDIMQRPEFQQIYIMGTEVYQQVRGCFFTLNLYMYSETCE